MPPEHVTEYTVTGTPVALPRETYRHGDLRQALITAGLELAREGGPAAARR